MIISLICSATSANELVLDTITSNSIPTIYSKPYSVTEKVPDWKRLWTNTAVLSGAYIGTLLVLECLPEDATSWNRAELQDVPLFKRWHNHVIKKVRSGIMINSILITFFTHMPELFTL